MSLGVVGTRDKAVKFSKPPEVAEYYFEKMMTNIGISVAELSKNHRVLMLFLTRIECPHCQFNVNEFAMEQRGMLQMNTFFVLVHQEPEEVLTKFLGEESPVPKFRENSDYLSRIIRVADPDLTYYDAFKVKNEFFLTQWSLERGFTTAARIKEGYSRTSSGVDVDSGYQRQVYVVSNSKVTAHWEYRHFEKVPDVKRLVIEEADDSINLQEWELLTKLPFFRDFCDYTKALPKTSSGSKKSESPKPKASCLTQQPSNQDIVVPSSETEEERQFRIRHESWTVSDALNNDETRRGLKLQALREHCAESVLFWEANNMHFKKLPEGESRKRELRIIIDSFLTPDSVLEINTNKQLVIAAEKAMHKEEVPIDILDPISKDLELNVLHDLYKRFRNSQEFQVLKQAGKIL